MNRLGVILVVFSCVAAASGRVPAQTNTLTPEKIRQWVGDLNSDHFKVRELASKNLKAAGVAALAPLAQAADGANAEVTRRALGILDEAAAAADPAIAKAAKTALRALLPSKHETVGRRAKAILARDLEQIVIVLEFANVGIQRTDGIVSGFKVPDGPEATIDLTRMSFDREFTLRDLFGDAEPRLLQHLATVQELNLFQTEFRDEGAKLFKYFPNLKRVPMGFTHITDAGLMQLKQFGTLEYVGIRGDRITDAGLVHLQALPLTGLNLNDTKVTDASLALLKTMSRMQMLYLSRTPITDRGLDHLHGLSELRYLELAEVNVSEEALTRLRQKIRNLQIAR